MATGNPKFLMGNASNIFKAFARVLKKSENNYYSQLPKVSIPESDDGHKEEYCIVERLGLIWGACVTIGCILLICILPYHINSTFRPPVVL